jgi:signal transduction histidine kinase
VNTAEAGILTYIRTNTESLHSWRRLIFVLSLLFGAMTLFVLTLCIIRNAKNKAQYAFEDYQRALTNNLAHDLKTPLAVIGGYTENVLQMRQDCGEETELEYLRAIMKNVAYTDEIIRKTLLLSETEQVSKPNKTTFDAAALVQNLTEKYSAALKERGITLNVSGSASLTADEDLFTAAAENLISNAVKYTPDGGSIRITLSRKQLAVVNDAAEDIDTKNLTMPFVKGDKARSDKRSSGLGLSIAAAAAERSGFSLKLDCSGKQFTAVLRF